MKKEIDPEEIAERITIDETAIRFESGLGEYLFLSESRGKTLYIECHVVSDNKMLMSKAFEWEYDIAYVQENQPKNGAEFPINVILGLVYAIESGHYVNSLEPALAYVNMISKLPK